MAAGDFYFAINATFRFILGRYGEQALYEYWRAMGNEYFAPLSARFRAGGLDEVARYWREFFTTEPGGDVEVTRHADRVAIDVRVCPAIAWLREHHRDIVTNYCEHCRHVSTTVATNAGLHFDMEGGGGSCQQWFETEDLR